MSNHFSVQWVVDALQGQLKRGNPETEYLGISTDSRTIKPGEIFLALKGDTFDGHDFISEVINKGALGVVLQSGRLISQGKKDFIVIEVNDTLYALGECAAHYRRLYGIPLVAVTGSNGKTTTKEMIAAILSTKRRVLKNQGNFNNLIGLPLSLLKLSSAHDVGVFELGMNRRGEIARLVEIAHPTVGVVTNVGPVHLEYLKTIDEVAEAKGELFQNLPSEATAIFNQDDPRIQNLSSRFSGKKITIGMKNPGDVTASNIVPLGADGMRFNLVIREKTLPVFLPMIGAHNVMNALAAAGAVTALGEEPAMIPEGLKNFRNLKLRQQLITLPEGITIINDTYNANPVSMKKALETFSLLQGSSRGIIILGDMLELGSHAAALHRELGREVAKMGVSLLLIMGKFSSDVREGALSGGLPSTFIYIGKNHQHLIDFLRGVLKPGDLVLVKGSRGMAMEKVVEGLMREDNPRTSKESGARAPKKI
ncbi:MAG: UDP-N-acetylmuramoyl-tripeptide--D-alanyl-D-alanine ligase [Thermodesulfobacteriota bacterium]|jgi:UDP-N-acetylmuramoyl-tripeptide--D-alanyl-D-alanine ligase|nr:MAG: UDP-N-acetylmuramoyl-tripeptide--D-alanyl-D-alanine ligase [Thermodesulfobacteriota bacterium]